MTANPLTSLSDYSRFVAELLSQPNVRRSTVAVWSDSPYTSVTEGEVFFTNGLRLRMREEVDLDWSDHLVWLRGVSWRRAIVLVR